jgi:hypothetical protein
VFECCQIRLVSRFFAFKWRFKNTSFLYLFEGNTRFCQNRHGQHHSAHGHNLHCGFRPRTTHFATHLVAKKSWHSVWKMQFISLGWDINIVKHCKLHASISLCYMYIAYTIIYSMHTRNYEINILYNIIGWVKSGVKLYACSTCQHAQKTSTTISNI